MVSPAARAARLRRRRRRLRAAARASAHPLGPPRARQWLGQSGGGGVHHALRPAARLAAPRVHPARGSAPRQLRQVQRHLRLSGEPRRHVPLPRPSHAAGGGARDARRHGAHERDVAWTAVRGDGERAAARATQLVRWHPDAMDPEQRPCLGADAPRRGLPVHRGRRARDHREPRRRRCRCSDHTRTRRRGGGGLGRLLVSCVAPGGRSVMSIIRLEALVLAALAAGASALPAVAQVPVSQAPATGSQYSFYMLRGHDTIIVERVARGPRSLVGEFKDPTGSLIRYTVQLDDSALIAHAMLSATPRGASPQVYDFAFVQDTLLITQPARDAATGTPPVRIHAVHGTLLQENPSVAFVEQMLMRARLIGGTATTQVPLLFTLGAAQVTATVAWIGADSATATINGTQMRLAVRNDGSIMGGTIPSQGIVIVRGPGGAPLVSGPAPDYSAPPGAPYTAENVV